MKTLYKKDSKGKIRQINFSINGNMLNMESGLVDGKLVLNTKECKSKNVGRSNATTAVDQAGLEMESRIKKKLDEGYFWTKEEAENKKVIAPMLAKDYKKEFKKVKWTQGVYIQPKLDGMRCLAIIKDGKVKLQSRDGKDIMITGGNSMQHIVDELSKIETNCILDGELYIHGLSFQENMKLIKKKRENSSDIKYNVYDIVDEGNYSVRKDIIHETIKNLDNNKVVQVFGNYTTVKAALKLIHEDNLSEGYEGSIIRYGDVGYKMSRSSNLLKYKNFLDIKAKLIDVVPGEQKIDRGVPVLKCIKGEHGVITGTEFRAGARLSHDEKIDLLKNKGNYIGRTCEIRFFEVTDDGNPRFPVLVGFINYE
jgi:DNA ligase-1